MKPDKKPTTVQELIDQLMNWNKKFLIPKDKYKQKEFIQLATQRCEPKVRARHFYFCGKAWPLLLNMEFTLTNDHIERGGEKIDQPYMINFNFNVN